MATLLFDLADPEQAKRFPKHGWAKNSQGIRLLWFPINNFLRNPQAIRAQKGISDQLEPSIRNTTPFYHTLNKLVVVLRELEAICRETADIPINTFDPLLITKQIRLEGLVAPYMDLAFIYLLRLADHFARYSRSILFADYDSLPESFESLRPRLMNAGQVKSAPLLCDPKLLSNAFINHTSWFEKLRSPNPRGPRGIRDVLEHLPSHLLVGKQQSGDAKPVITVFLNPKQGQPLELISTLREALADLCEFFTTVCDSAGLRAGYQHEDYFYFSGLGRDDDITGFWPEI